jgi:hypothetical protein
MNDSTYGVQDQNQQTQQTQQQQPPVNPSTPYNQSPVQNQQPQQQQNQISNQYNSNPTQQNTVQNQQAPVVGTSPRPNQAQGNITQNTQQFTPPNSGVVGSAYYNTSPW